MKSFYKYLIISLTVVYIIFSMVMWNLNPATWGIWTRLLFIVMVIIVKHYICKYKAFKLALQQEVNDLKAKVNAQQNDN